MPKPLHVLALILALSLFSSISFAFTASAPSQTFNVPLRTTNQIDIALTSNTDETVTANFIDSKPWITLSDSQVTLAANKPKNLSVFVSPLDTNEGLYKISIFFESLKTKELGKADIYVYVEKKGIVNIEKIVVTGSLQPLGSAKISIHVKNLKTVTVQSVEVTTDVLSPTHKVGEIRQTIPRLDPDESSIVETTIYFDNQAESGSYSVNAVMKTQGETMTAGQTFNVQQKSVVQKTEERSSSLFGYSKRIYLTNNGNAPGDFTVTEGIARLDRAFFSGDEPTEKSDAGYVWTMSGIKPGETKIIKYSIDFSPLFFFIIVLALAAWIYTTRFRTVKIKKYILQKKNIVEGEEFTVAVEVTNSSGRQTDIEVHDFIPAVFETKDTEGPKPSRKKSSVGYELTWHSKTLHPRESRIFTYKIVPMFGLNGIIKLPKASVVFESHGHKLENKSLAPSVGIAEAAAQDQLWNKFFRKGK